VSPWWAVQAVPYVVDPATGGTTPSPSGLKTAGAAASAAKVGRCRLTLSKPS
jgi:hypothetical protein